MQKRGFSQEEGWKAPAWADTLTNPYPGAVQEGKEIYLKNCANCHGADARGGGVSGRGLSPRTSNLTAPPTQNQSDGALYWKITKGKSPMPSYEFILSKEDRWKVVVH